MLIDRLQYELKLSWKMLLVVPVLAIGVIALFALLQFSIHQSTARTWLSIIEIFLPLAAGIVATVITTHDPALELHLTLPHTYYSTSILRLLLVLLWCTCLAVCCLIGIIAFNAFYAPVFTQMWSPGIRFLILQLLWLAPLLWFVATGTCAALLTQSRTASGTLLGGIWLFDILFSATISSVAWLRPLLLFPATLIIFPATKVSNVDFNMYWLVTRFDLLGMSLVFFLLSWFLLRNTERLLKGATEE